MASMATLRPENVDTLVIHTTDSLWGDVATVDEWHKDRGWAGIGYHFLITNCFPTRYRFETKRPLLDSDGAVHIGRPERYCGAHAQGHNWHSIGIALVGKHGMFSAAQIKSAVSLCKKLKERYPVTKIVGHFELFDGKTCPDLDMDLFREWVDLLGG